jgi:hypothetical protein
LYAVIVESGALAHESDLFDLCLCDEQPVERVAVVEWQAGNLRRMSRLNRQDRHAIDLDFTIHELVEWLG